MQTAVKSNLYFTSFSSFNHMADWMSAIRKPELNHQISQALIRLTNRRQSFEILAARLITIADRAYPFRQMDVVEQASDILLNLPLPREFKSIANYYKGFCIKRRGQFEAARALFEQVADDAPLRYRARAIIALGSIAFDSSDYQSAMPLYIEGGRAALLAREFDPLAAYYTQFMLAILKSVDGDHRGTLKDLERIFPLVRAIGSYYPPIYYNYLNSLAVEFLEVGQLTEAQNVSKIVLASPYAAAYPEYRETGIDIALRGRRSSRSVVSLAGLNLNTQNVLSLPSAEHVSGGSTVMPASGAQEPARVLCMQKWKEKMGNEPNGDQKDGKSPNEMAQDEMLYEIIHIFTEPDMDAETRLEMLESIQKIAAKNRGKKQGKDSSKDPDQD